MSVKSVNLRGYKTAASRSRRSRREGSALLDAMRAVGMSDEEIKVALLDTQAPQQSPTPDANPGDTPDKEMETL